MSRRRPLVNCFRIESRGIYQITCLKNGKRYIGSSDAIGGRLERHWELLRGGRHFNRSMQASWNKYGSGEFVAQVISVVSGDLFAAEELMLQARRPEFNATLTAVGGPMRGRRHGRKARLKMTAGQKRYWGRRRAAGGGTLTSEHKAKIAAAHCGKKASRLARRKMRVAARNRPPISEETRQRLSDATRNNPACRRGRKLSAVTRQRLSESHKGYRHTPEQRRKISESLKLAYATGKRKP